MKARALKENILRLLGKAAEADALRAITIRAAEHVGVADWIGSIGVGKDADFVLTDKSIFDAEYEVIYTIIDGKIVGGKGL